MTSEVTETVANGTTPAEAVPANEPEAKSKAAGLTAKRLEKVDDHLRESLDKADSLEANLGVVSADLMRMACRLTVAIEESLGKRSLEQYRQARPNDRRLSADRTADRPAGDVGPPFDVVPYADEAALGTGHPQRSAGPGGVPTSNGTPARVPRAFAAARIRSPVPIGRPACRSHPYILLSPPAAGVAVR